MRSAIRSVLLLGLLGVPAFAQNPAGSAPRNNTPEGRNIPVTWDCEKGVNIKWSAPLGSQTLGSPVASGGKIFVGTNNGAGYLKRYPANVDLNVLLCFEEATGKFLWQHSTEKHPKGRVHDWPFSGVCSTPLIEGRRLWYVTNRAEVVCLDTEGFRDSENDGPFVSEKPQEGDWDEKHEADVLWKFDMLGRLGVRPHNWSTCAVASAGHRLFVMTGNGVDESHLECPAPEAPSFLCLDRTSGEVLWADNSPGANVMHGQWASPVHAVFDGRPQVLFPGGDGWLYSFDPAGENGRSKLLWKVDLNPKGSKYALQGATRSFPMVPPTIDQGLVYITVGDDPDHGSGVGHVWCINPVNQGGDVSATLVFNKRAPDTPLPPRRLAAMLPDEGDFERPNPRSAVVWRYDGRDPTSKDYTDVMHRCQTTLAIKDGLLIAADFEGAVHCLDAKSGRFHWAFDVQSYIFGSPLIVEGKVYVGDGDGDVHIFALSRTLQTLGLRDNEPQHMPASSETAPMVSNNVLFIADRNTLWAIAEGAQSKPPRRRTLGDE